MWDDQEMIRDLIALMGTTHVYYCVRGGHYGVTPYHVLYRCHMGCV